MKLIKVGKEKILVLAHPTTQRKTGKDWIVSSFNASGDWRGSSGFREGWTEEEARKKASKERTRLRKLERDKKKK